MHSKDSMGTSLVVLVVKTVLPLLGVQVPALVGKLRSCMPNGVAKKEEKKKKIVNYPLCWEPNTSCHPFP